MKGCILEADLDGREFINNTVYRFVASSLVTEIFLKKMEHQKMVRWNRGTKLPLFTFYWGFKKTLYKGWKLLFCFLVIKRILKALFPFIFKLLSSSDLLSYGSNSKKKIHTKAIVNVFREEHPSLWFPFLFISRRWAPLNLALHWCSG